MIWNFTFFILKLIELDGTKKGPHVIVEKGCTDVLRGSIAEIKRRLDAGEISHSLSMMTLNATGHCETGKDEESTLAAVLSMSLKDK